MIELFTSTMMSVMELCLIIAVGFIIGKTVMPKDSTKTLSILILNCALPALLISALQEPFDKLRFQQGLSVVVFNFLGYVLALILGLLFIKVVKGTSGEKKALLFNLLFGNVAFMGFPILRALYGPESIFFGTLCNVIFSLLINTFGVYILSYGETGEKNKLDWKILLSPQIVAVLVGLVLFFTSTTLPSTIGIAVKSLGGITTPLSMLVIGILLTQTNFKTLFTDWRLFVHAAMRLLLIPFITFVIAKPFVSDPTLLGVIVILAGMPAATSGASFAIKYGGDSVYASKIISIHTLCSLLTIPLLRTFVATVI